MANVAAVPAGAAAAPAKGNAPAPVVPFVRASFPHREDLAINQTFTLSAAQQTASTVTVPAYGYLRSLCLQVTATGATGAGVLSEDAPFNVLQNISVTEPNGAPIYGPITNGFSAYLIQKWGGYRAGGIDDAKLNPGYSTDGSGNFSFILRIPVEIIPREALGALPNQNDTARFRLKYSVAPNSVVYSTQPTVQPTITVTGWMEAWDQPSQDSGGLANQITPPAMNTTQFWSEALPTVGAGQQQLKIDRLGNYIRNIIFVHRRNGGTRANGQTDFPDPITFFLDARPMDFLTKNAFLEQMAERGQLRTNSFEAAGGPNNGVFVYDFTSDFDGSIGFELRNRWLGTLGSERLEWRGSFANAGTTTVLVNDVAVAGSVWS